MPRRSPAEDRRKVSHGRLPKGKSFRARQEIDAQRRADEDRPPSSKPRTADRRQNG